MSDLIDYKKHVYCVDRQATAWVIVLMVIQEHWISLLDEDSIDTIRIDYT
jgi:hypothetical protein